MNLWEGIDDRPPKLREFTPEEAKRIEEELARLPERSPEEINKPRTIQTKRGPITFCC